MSAQYKFGINENVLSKRPSRLLLGQHICMLQIYCKHAAGPLQFSA